MAQEFPKAGVQAWKEQLERDFASGLPFDLAARRFVQPELPVGSAVPTVFELTELYYMAHPEWEPKTKLLAAMAFGRARRWLLAGGVEPEGLDLDAVEDFTINGSFLPDHLSHELTDRQAAGRKWLMAHSAPTDSLSTRQVGEFVRRFEVNQRNQEKRVSAATLTPFLQPLKACWTWAVGPDDIPIDRNPWLTIKPRRKVKGKSSLANGRGALAVDADMVIGMPEAFALAQACIEYGSWGGVVECFVLVMAMCGLRPGEAAGLLWEDLDLPPGTDAGWVTVRRTHRPMAARWLDHGEDPDWGPLKDRDIAESRRAPVHPKLVEKLLRHREIYGVGPDGLVFHRNDKPFDPDMFNKSVWQPGRAAL